MEFTNILSKANTWTLSTSMGSDYVATGDYSAHWVGSNENVVVTLPSLDVTTYRGSILKLKGNAYTSTPKDGPWTGITDSGSLIEVDFRDPGEDEYTTRQFYGTHEDEHEPFNVVDTTVPFEISISIPATTESIVIKLRHCYGSLSSGRTALLQIDDLMCYDASEEYTENPIHFHKVLASSLPTSVDPGSQHIYFAKGEEKTFMYVANNQGELEPISAPGAGGEQIQSDWNQTDTTAVDYIRNKPTALSSFTDDLGSNPTHTHSQYSTTTTVNAINNRLIAVEGKIPSQASTTNQLADKSFVNSSIATNTANFLGTNTTATTEAAFLTWANTLSNKTNNDYVFWGHSVDGNNVYDRYKYVASSTSWVYEYRLNNSSFTANQWAAINSGITEDLVEAFETHTSDEDVHVTTTEKETWNNKANTNNPSFTGDVSINGSLKFQNNLTKVSSPTVVAAWVGNDSKNGLGFAQTSDLNVGHSTSADSVPWTGVSGKPDTFPPSSHTHSTSDITSGTFDLARIPTIPATKTSGFATVATSGSYNDLSNKPSIEDITYPYESSTYTGTGIWYIRIRSKNAWITTNEYIKIHSEEGNRVSDTVICTCTRHNNFWGYTSYYNGKAVDGICSEFESYNDLYIRVSDGFTSIKVYSTYEVNIDKADYSGKTYFRLPNGGFFASSLTGNLNGVASSAASVDWSGIQNKPTAYPPEAHSHSEYVKLSTTNTQQIESTSINRPLDLKGNSTYTLIGFRKSDGTYLGGLGANAENKPLFHNGSANVEISLAGHTHSEDMKLTSSGSQVINSISAATPVILKSGDANRSQIGFYGSTGTNLGFLGVNTTGPYFLNNSTTTQLSLNGHTHDDRYYTETEINDKLATKSDTSHTHDDRYYTETEVNTKLSYKENSSNKVTSWSTTVDDTHFPSEKLVKNALDGKSDTSHTHDDRYYTEGEVDTKLATKANLSGADFTGAVSVKGTGNAVTNISGATSGVDYAKLYVTGSSYTNRPLVINGEVGAGIGNVAIGNIVAPTNKLEVDGNIKATGKLYSGSTEVSLVGHNHNDLYYTENEVDTKLAAKANLSGDTFTGDVIFNAPHRDSHYASNLCRHFYNGEPTEFVIKTKIKYVSSAHMPLIRIHGYAYGAQSPIELRVVFYIWNGNFVASGAVSTGAWKPEVYLYKYTENSVDYVAVGFKGACYFCGFQVDAQVGALGSFGDNFSIDGWSTTHNGTDTSVSLIPAVGTSNCIKVDYKAMKTDISGSAGSVAWDNVTGKPGTFPPSSHNHAISEITNLQTSLDNKANTSGTYSGLNVGHSTNTGDGAINIIPSHNNEVNFGGSNASPAIYFGYRAEESRPIPTDFYFGASGGAKVHGKLNWSDVTDTPSTFPPSSHNHDDRYYTETEMDSKLSGKSDTGHNHDDRYYTEGEVDTKLSTKENSSNKVTSWSTTTTDAHYPSEKLVKTALDGKASSSHTHDDRYYAKTESDNKYVYRTHGMASAITLIDATFEGADDHTVDVRVEAGADNDSSVIHFETGGDTTVDATYLSENGALLASKYAPKSHTHGNITNDGKLTTASRALVTDSDKKITTSSVTSTELGYLSGVSSSVQNQLNNKENSSNKVTSWSTTTTDAHYPSEKLVKTALDGKANTSGTYDNLNVGSLTSFDTRGSNPTPVQLTKGARFDFRQNSTDGLNDGGSYHGVMSWRSYGTTTDLSGGEPCQIAYTENSNIWYRTGSGSSSWNNWIKLSKDGHTHDDRYYTESEIDTKLTGKSDTGHTHSASNITSGTFDLARIPTIPSTKTSGFATVATSGSYNDLSNKPNIPSKTSQLTNDSGFLTSHQDISGKENSSNKVTSWSTTTTDTHYPSEKLVKTALDGKASSSHTHDDRYYTRTESDNKYLPKSHGYATAITLSGATFEGRDDSYVDVTVEANGSDEDAIINFYTSGESIVNATKLAENGVLLSGKYASKSHSHGNITNAGELTTASKALITDGNKKITTSDVTSTELGYLSGVTSAIQTQLNNKASSSHNHAASNITSGTLDLARIPTIPSTKTSGFKTVATSGSYNDLTDKPTIPTKTSQLTNDSGFLTSHQDISGKENSSNKVTSWSTTTTDTHYPSEKLVKSALDSKANTNQALLKNASDETFYIVSGDDSLLLSETGEVGEGSEFINMWGSGIDFGVDGGHTVELRATRNGSSSITGLKLSNGAGSNSTFVEADQFIGTASSANSVPWNGIPDKPSTFPPSSHSHGNITNDGKLTTASRALVTDGDKKITTSNVTSTELGYLSGVTSAIQTQLGNKENSSNKVTSWSTTTTDAHYPSEKLVKTALDGKANTSGTYSGMTVGNATNAQNAGYADYASVSDWNNLDNKPNTLNIQFTVGGSTYSYDVFYEEV